MSAEDRRARFGARNFRRQLLAAAGRTSLSCEELIGLASQQTGFRHVLLPKDDPLLAGADGLLDRDFETIWLSSELDTRSRNVTISHEYGHLMLHVPAAPPELVDNTEKLDGYSSQQRDERDAEIFAAEFLLPSNEAHRLFHSGVSASRIAGKFNLPYRLVIRQLSSAPDLFSSTPLSWLESPIELDRWQNDAINGQTPALVIGNSGTGKSASLVARCKLLLEKGTDPRQLHIVVADLQSASDMRLRLISADIRLAAASVSTPGQIAYDILVRYGGVQPDEPANSTSTARSERVKAIIHKAAELVSQMPEIRNGISGHFIELLVDDIDRLSIDAFKVVTAAVPAASCSLWATAEGYLGLEKQIGPLAEAARFSLPCQYRQSSAMLEWMHLLSRHGERKPLDRRHNPSRFGDGGVAIAVCISYEQMAAGIKQSASLLVEEGYALEDIVLSYPTGDKSAAAALGSVHLMHNAASYSQPGALVKQLLAFLELTLNEWSIELLTTVSMMPEYQIPVQHLVQKCASLDPAAPLETNLSVLNSVDHPGAVLLSSHIRMCSVRRSLRSRLSAYLYDVSNCLRIYPEWISVPEFMMQRLPWDDLPTVEKLQSLSADLRLRPTRTTGIIRSMTELALTRIRAPILIVAGQDLQTLVDALSTKPDVNAKAALRAQAATASDSILYCVSAQHRTKALAQAKAISSSYKQVSVRDWTCLKALQSESVDSGNHAEGDVKESVLFAQCPRRVYYTKRLQPFKNMPELLLSADYPPSPADTAMCISCRFAHLCPAEVA